MYPEKPLLILKRASKNRESGQWPDVDYDVFDADKNIGRNLWTNAAPEGRRWFWTITTRIPQSTADRGYATTLEQPTADFKSAWGP